MELNVDLIERPTILVVDDVPDNLMLMSGLLGPHYKVKVANNSERALKIAASGSPPDLILLDIMMPDMDGYEVCRRLKANPATWHIPVIFLTARSEVEDEQKGFDIGAADFLTKPVSPPIVLARIRNHLELKAHADFLRAKGDFLETEVRRRTREVAAIHDVTLLAMMSLAETRDEGTGNHIRRTQFYVRALAQKLQSLPKYRDVLTDQRIDMLFKSAPMHDIGKAGIPDRILLEPGRFEPHQFETMKTHTTLGRDAIEWAENLVGSRIDFLRVAKEIAVSHHEKWDGSGYPLGLTGETIPLSGRLMAVADVYDALISRRVYKKEISHREAAAIIIEGRGKQFDPEIVDAFVELQDQFQAIALCFADGDGDSAEMKP